MIRLTKIQEEVLLAIVRLHRRYQDAWQATSWVRDERMVGRPRDPRYDYIRSTEIALTQLSQLCPNLVEHYDGETSQWRATHAGVVLTQTQLHPDSG